MENRKHKSYLAANRRSGQWIGWIFISPFVFGFIFIFLNMICSAVSYAFCEVNMRGDVKLQFVGLSNFYYALRVDATYTQTLLSTLQSMLTTVPMILIFSLFISVLLNGGVKGRSVFRAIFFLPVIATTGLISRIDMQNLVMDVMMSATSSAEQETTALGDVSMFLQQLEFSPSLISFISNLSSQIVDIVNLSGVQILIFLAAIQSISPSVYEAADVEGASGWLKFWKITIPMVMPIMVVNLLYSVIDFLTRDNTAMTSFINAVGMGRGEYGPASAMAWLYCLSVFLVLFLVFLVYKLIRRVYTSGE